MANQNFRVYYYAGFSGLLLDLAPFDLSGLALNGQALSANGTVPWVYETGNVSGSLSGHYIGRLRDATGQLDQLLHFNVLNEDGIYEGITTSPRAVVGILDSAILSPLMTEPTAAPEWGSASLGDVMAWLLALSRNRVLQTTNQFVLRNDADDGAIATAGVSHDGSTYDREAFT